MKLRPLLIGIASCALAIASDAAPALTPAPLTPSAYSFGPGSANIDLAKLDVILPGRHVSSKVPKLPDNLFAVGGGQMNNRSRDLQNEFAVQMKDMKATAVYWAPIPNLTRKRYEEMKDEKGQVLHNADGSPKRVLREALIPVEEQASHMVVIEGHVLRVGSYLPRALIKGDARVQIAEISQGHVRLAGEMQSVGFDGRPTKVPAYTNIPVDAHEVLLQE